MRKFLDIHKLFMKNLFILNLYFFISINSYLIIPLKYYPIYKYNNANTSEIMKSIVSSKLYAIIEVGTPKKQIEIPLDFEAIDFFISDYPIKEFEENNLFSDLKFYSGDESSSRIEYTDIEFYGDKFEFAQLCTESFFFNNSKYEFEFYFPYKLKETESGGIGLLLQPRYSVSTDLEKTFFRQLKVKNMIKGYYWSVFFNKRDIEKEGQGFILLGSLPHELGTDLGYYDKKYFQGELKNVGAEMSGSNFIYEFKMDEITVYEGNKKNKILNYSTIIDDIYMKHIELNYHSNGVQAPYNLFEKYKEIFIDNSNGECFMSNFTYIQRKNFFYCNNKKDVIKKIKGIFPGFNFLSRDLNYSFYLDVDDLFLEKDGYVFCLLYFNYGSYQGKNWIMGKPFLSKYQFSFNPDSKQFYFYRDEKDSKDSKDSNDSNGGIKVNVLIIIIIGTIILVSVVCFLLFKFYLYDLFMRKRRANELDDDFDYIEKKEEGINNENIPNPGDEIN